MLGRQKSVPSPQDVHTSQVRSAAAAVVAPVGHLPPACWEGIWPCL